MAPTHYSTANKNPASHPDLFLYIRCEPIYAEIIAARSQIQGMTYEWIALILFFLWMAYKDYQIFRLKRDLAELNTRQAHHFEQALARDSEIITSIFIAEWPEHKTPESVRQAFDNIVAEQTTLQEPPE